MENNSLSPFPPPLVGRGAIACDDGERTKTGKAIAVVFPI